MNKLRINHIYYLNAEIFTSILHIYFILGDVRAADDRAVVIIQSRRPAWVGTGNPSSECVSADIKYFVGFFANTISLQRNELLYLCLLNVQLGGVWCHIGNICPVCHQ